MKNSVIKEFQRAVFFSDINTIRQIIESEDFDKRILTDLGIYKGTSIPVTYFTAAQLEIFRDAEEWSKGKDWVVNSKDRAIEVWHFWKDVLQLGLDIDYHCYAEPNIMFCNDFETDEEILDMTYNEVEKKGLRIIDAKLYVACWRVDIDKVNQLFNAGANPNAFMNVDEDNYIMDHVAAEAAYLDTLIYPIYESYSNGKQKSILYERNYLDLIGFGAFERMYNILHCRGLLDYSVI